jgi:hypothetical protein
MANTEGTWLSILDYSHFKKVSISTIRRHIKANLVRWKEQDGKHYVWTASAASDIETRREGEVLALKFEIERLRMENRLIAEELSEARMLIRLYEGGAELPQENTL